MPTNGPNQSVKLTKTVVTRASPPTAGQCFLRDAQLKGFGLRITAGGTRTFIVEKRVHGKMRRETLGRFGELTVEQARRKAQQYLGQIAMGEDPRAERERARLRTVTLAQAFEAFKRARALKPRTLYDYERLLVTALGTWRDRPLAVITNELVARRHHELGAASGKTYANSAMRFLRSVFNFAMAQYEDGTGRPVVDENPVQRLTRTRAWFPDRRRQTLIKVTQLPGWYAAVEALRADESSFAETVADYLLFLLFTGLRRSEAALLTWDRVDLKDASLRILDTKNHDPHVLPLGPFVIGLLERRRRKAQSVFVFPGEGPAGYLIEPKRYVVRATTVSGVAFILHDLRRTFITVAEAIGTSPYAIKRLVNHRVRSDVTEGYIVSDLERLREPMRQIERYLLRAVGQEPSAKVLPLRGEPEDMKQSATVG